jgi:AbrB family looped-hinge helix DNA binding protein
VVIPGEARKALGVKPGDKLLFVVLGEQVVVMRKPESFAKALRGIGRGLYGDEYLRKERDSWE